MVTSGWRGEGLSSLYPPNLPVGEVKRAPIDEREAIQTVEMSPFPDLRNLDLLQVLTGRQSRMIVTTKVAVRIALVVLLAVLLQNAFFSLVEVLGVSFWILPAIVAIFGLLGGSMIGATVGFAIGFLADGLIDGPLGTACLVFMGIGYATGLYRERGKEPPALAAAIIAGTATFVANLALGVFATLLGFDGYLSAAAMPDLLIQSILRFLAGGAALYPHKKSPQARTDRRARQPPAPTDRCRVLSVRIQRP